jgi:hypothetical protein
MSETQPPARDVSGAGLGQPAVYVFNITPDDDSELHWITRALRVGTAGDLAIKTIGGSVVVIPDVLAGETIVVRAIKVYATSTTASGIVGLA